MKKQILATVFAAALALPFAANAAEPVVTSKQLGGGAFSGSVSFTNSYLYRGLPQSGGIPALQGDIGYSQPIGPVSLSVGAWGSNVDFNDGDEASIEIDYTMGLSGEVKGFSWGVGGIYYTYPGANSGLNYDFWEVYGTLGYDFKVASAEIGINYSPEFFGESGDAVYYSGSVNVPLGKYVDLGLHVGYQTIDNNTAYGVPDYLDYQISLGTNVAGVDLSVAWNDTDLDDSDCGKCGQFLVTVGKSF